MKNCERCSAELKGKQSRWCSLNCSRLGLKSEYKKRHRDKVSAYAREYRKKGPRALTFERRRDFVTSRGDVCNRCGKIDGNEIHHIKPLRSGGTNHPHNMMMLCKKCHTLWHKMIGEFFDK